MIFCNKKDKKKKKKKKQNFHNDKIKQRAGSTKLKTK